MEELAITRARAEADPEDRSWQLKVLTHGMERQPSRAGVCYRLTAVPRKEAPLSAACRHQVQLKLSLSKLTVISPLALRAMCVTS